MLPELDRLATLALALFFLLLVSSAHAARKGVWRRVEAVSGQEAVLPCEVGSFEPADMVYVVLWYRNGNKEPIYSYDNRPGRLQASEERHTIKSPLLEGRVSFRLGGQVPALHILTTQPQDQANYTCRVDFRIASSRRTHLSLHVVVPPSDPLLRVGGQKATNGVLGPLQEGAALELTCSVRGGVPPPAVVWVRQGEILDSTVESRSSSLSVNRLNILRLSRDYHNTRLTCVASNNNVTEPSIASVTVTMNLRPLVARIESPPKYLRVGNEYELACVVAGSRPHPNITWTLGNAAELTAIPAETDHGVNKSTSRVMVRGARRLHGQRLTCTATNPLFPAAPLVDTVLLNVTYPPVATMELGRGVSPVVREGEDVYFNCIVDSNPPTYKIAWYRKKRPIEYSPSEGVVISGQHLALRGITRHQAGPYTCAASNVEGDAHSPPLNLSVNYAPVCEDEGGGGGGGGGGDKAHKGKTKGKAKGKGGDTKALGKAKVLATGLGQEVKVRCRVRASPPSLRYSWVFNNSLTSHRIPGDQVVFTEDGGSAVQFVARTHQDYGTLQCWAQNEVGKMKHPCLFHVVPAGRPEQPVECRVVNKTYNSLAVDCTPGFDGGLEQVFVARVFEAVTKRGQVNVTSDAPRFSIEGLTPGLDYVIQVSARNRLGSSDPFQLVALTYKMAENRMRNEQGGGGGDNGNTSSMASSSSSLVTKVLAVGGGVAAVAVAVVAGAVLAGRCVWARRRRRRGSSGGGHFGSSNRGYAAPDEKHGARLSDEDEGQDLPTIRIETHREPLNMVDEHSL